MRYGILADAHGHHKALEKALHLLNDVDRIIFLGDVPNYRNGDGFVECLEALYAEDAQGVQGNCDEYVVMQYTRPSELAAQIWNDYVAWPKEYRDGELLFVHGGPRDPLNERIGDEERAWKNFRAHEFKVCFHGHQHRVSCFAYHDDDVAMIELQDNVPFVLDSATRYIIGVGSVGMPKDDQKGSMVLYDSLKGEVLVRRFTRD
ncbi:metallophosphoesterase family protein [Heliobacterium chlorum]|uniref:Metallophosphoesterase family protein n=1 Tax=Heliobacterium chlorum TaxID=2698 RepID=A0ABR7SXC8_HELCL|nr:metallophosphoesterase family protein [Heliobacterium chlorum]MBC9783199.1 metallophosphoesterase family protein [Heliobacterium chlorum]